MMELIDGSKNYLSTLQQGVHMNLNTALLSSLITPPRRPNKKRLSLPVADCSRGKFRTPMSTNSAIENLSRSLPKQGSVDRNSPSRMSPSQLFGKPFYAGAKFGERPLPAELPSPPNHWVNKNKKRGSKEQSCIEMTNDLKVLLKVQS